MARDRDIKFSIITVCLNAEKVIRPTIESVLKQDYKNFEYIVVDGVSMDGTLEIIQEYSQRIKGYSGVLRRIAAYLMP